MVNALDVSRMRLIHHELGPGISNVAATRRVFEKYVDVFVDDEEHTTTTMRLQSTGDRSCRYNRALKLEDVKLIDGHFNIGTDYKLKSEKLS